MPLPSAPSNDSIAPEVVRSELQDALVDLFDAISVEAPLLLAIDDAHHLDSASWAVLRELSRRLHDRSLMVLFCTRTSQHALTRPAPLRLKTYALGRLSEQESRSLLLSLAPERAADLTRLERDVRSTGGNPLLIHAVARFPRSSANSDDVPLDISIIASSAYHSLDEGARTVLESILLLNELASLSRLRDISSLDDNSFLRSLRYLEEESLVRRTSGGIACSHDIIADALRGLIPQTVSAVLNRRIASRLEAECVDSRLDATLAWAAAQAWIAGGEPSAAAHLVRRCAAHALALGEPAEAAKVLGRLLEESLPREDALGVTEELISMSDAGGDGYLRARAIQERIRLLQEGPVGSRSELRTEIAALNVSYLEGTLHITDDVVALSAQLRAVLRDSSLEAIQRLRAAPTAIIIADLQYDKLLAEEIWCEASSLISSVSPGSTSALRTQLIFHTIFGDTSTAIAIARQLIDDSTESMLEPKASKSRRNALFALHALGCSDHFYEAAVATFEFMRAKRVHSWSIYIGSLVAERLFEDGDMQAAIEWLERLVDDVDRVHPIAGGAAPGYYSTLAAVAATCDRLPQAGQLLLQVRSRLLSIETPRMKSIDDAQWMRLSLFSGAMPSEREIGALAAAYHRGCVLGRQDTIVEALWLAYRSRGEGARASALLRDYLTSKRREVSVPEWSLRRSTRDDAAWGNLGFGDVGDLTLHPKSRVKLDRCIRASLRAAL